MDQRRFKPSSSKSILKDSDIIIICVPTSLDKHHTPDLTNLHSAFEVVAGNFKKDNLMSFKVTTYPGTTEGELLSRSLKKPA